MTAFDLKSFLDNLTTQFSLSGAAWQSGPSAASFQYFQKWLEEGLHGEMDYLEKRLEARRSLKSVFPEYQSHLLITVNYKPHPKPLNSLPGVQVASYAQGEDYHDWLRELLVSIGEEILKVHPGARLKYGTDILPILERDFAAQAGLGWIGKNTCLIHPQKGSFFFIAEILTDIPLTNGLSGEASQEEINSIEPIPDFCGKCTRCIDACPTGAIESPRKLNATRCISYWTIESQSVPPLELRKPLGDWFFGCDICQTVCPWNEKVFRGKQAEQRPPARNDELIESLRWILTASNREIEARLGATPLIRARPFGLRRNALIVVANLRVVELRCEVEALLEHPRLGELARWSLGELKS